MSAADTVEALLQLGMAAKDAFTKAKQGDGSLDWVKFLDSAEFKKVETELGALVGALTKTELDAAIAAIRQKESTLLGGQPVSKLPSDKLLQYSDLLDTETVLVNRKIHDVTLTPEALKWVVDDLLPILVDVAKVVLPLLL